MISILSDQLCTYLNTSSPFSDEEIEEIYLPMSIKVLRKILTPNNTEKKTTVELDSDLVKIEDRLNLNKKARQRLRKLLFPSDNELLEMSTVSDFPTPSPQKSRFSAPSRLTSTKKRKMILEKEVVEKYMPHSKNLIDNKNTPKSRQNSILQWVIPTDLRPKKTKKNINKKEQIINKNQIQETGTSLLSRNSSFIFQTPKDSIASPLILPTIACTGLSKRYKFFYLL